MGSAGNLYGDAPFNHVGLLLGPLEDMSCLYRHGVAVAHDDGAALEWLRKAAEQGRASAQNDVGWSYQQGLGVAQNYDEALRSEMSRSSSLSDGPSARPWRRSRSRCVPLAARMIENAGQRKCRSEADLGLLNRLFPEKKVRTVVESRVRGLLT
jgi:Sel1 repeat